MLHAIILFSITENQFYKQAKVITYQEKKRKLTYFSERI